FPRGALEGRAEEVAVDVRPLVAHPGPDRRPAAPKGSGAQRLHRPRQIASMHQEVDVLREALVAVLDHGEAAGDGKVDPGLAQDAADARQRLVHRAGGNLAHPCGLQELAIAAECRGAPRSTARFLSYASMQPES